MLLKHLHPRLIKPGVMLWDHLRRGRIISFDGSVIEYVCLGKKWTVSLAELINFPSPVHISTKQIIHSMRKII